MFEHLEVKMRLRIDLRPENYHYKIPINYQYPLAGGIYHILFTGNQEFANWLHKEGYVLPNQKKIKLFTFSKLFTKYGKIKDGILQTDGDAYFFFSSPVKEQHITTFVQGILSMDNLKISTKRTHTNFQISSVNSLEPPEFEEKMKYKMLSPAVASTVRTNGDKKYIHYYRADEEELPEKLEANLRRKYRLLHGRDYDGKLKITLDRDYIARKHTSKLVTIKEGHGDQVKVKAFECPVIIEGNEDMQKVAYDCGVGEKGSLGFGMLGKINAINSK